MPTYFLHIQEGGDSIRDQEGHDYADLASAQDEAIAGARSLVSASAQLGVLPLSHQIRIADETGQIVMVITFADAVAIR